MKKQYGAMPSTWDAITLFTDLSADLLPVVSNPEAKAAPGSTLKLEQRGKTPSRYNASGEVVGIGAWTDHLTTDAEIANWSANPDYGCCIVGRRLRGIDVDVTDPARAAEIEAFLASRLPRFPKRYRANSSKFLIPIRIDGDPLLTKRRFYTAPDCKDPIEFLANKQQFLIDGTHTSGARYEWQGGVEDYPTVTLDEFDTLWGELVDKFATEGGNAKQYAERPNGETYEAVDPVADYLDAKGYVHGKTAEGALLCTCPFDHLHSSGTPGDTSTVYFPIGLRGFDKGTFYCSHTHHEGHTQRDYLDAIGYVEDHSAAFDYLPANVLEPDYVVLRPLPRTDVTFELDERGRVAKTPANFLRAVKRPEICGYVIGYDAFKQSIAVAPNGDTSSIVTMEDYHLTDIRLNISKHPDAGGLVIPLNEIREIVPYVANLNKFDSLQLAVSDLPAWDGVQRVEESFITYFGAEDTPYIRELGKAWWTGLLGRALNPGCFLKLVPIAMGGQDIGKSRTIRAMCLLPTHFKEIDFAKDNKDLCVSFQGAIVGEIAELAGFKGKSLEHLKKIISQQADSWRPPYQRFDLTANRRICFFGTTNDDTFLSDSSGESRWFPFVATKGDYVGIGRDVRQLWAEAKVLFEKNGIMYVDAKRLAAPEQQKFKDEDPWLSSIAKWLDAETLFSGSEHNQVANGDLSFTTSDVLTGALDIPQSQQSSYVARRAAAILRELGYEQSKCTKVRIDGRSAVRRLWAKGSA